MAKYWFPNADVLSNVLYSQGYGKRVTYKDLTRGIEMYDEPSLVRILFQVGKTLILWTQSGKCASVKYDETTNTYLFEDEYLPPKKVNRYREKRIKDPAFSNRVRYYGQEYTANGINDRAVRTNHPTKWLDSRDRWD